MYYEAAVKLTQRKELCYMHFYGTIWRPPYEAHSLLIQATAGCTHHACKFCTLYDDLPFKFRMSPLSEVEEDLAEAKKHVRRVDRIFFVGANPFVLRTDKLKALAALARSYYPDYRSIGCFGRITDITPKSVEELRELQALGYDGLTLGVETGDDAALSFMNKGYTSQDILQQCRKLEKAGISYNFFYLTGIAGAGKGVESARRTAAVFNQLQPKVIDASMLTIYANSRLYQEIQQGNWQEPGELEKLRELQALIAALNIKTRFATDGASNLVQVRGCLPQDKELLVNGLERLLAKADEKSLRDYRVHLKHL